jgi:hypothetical protein
MTDSFEGKEPKSRDQIRSSLELLRSEPKKQGEAGSDRISAGPHIKGLPASHPITIAQFLNPENAKLFQLALSRSGLFSQSSAHGRATRIVVDFEDAKLAAKVYKTHKAKHPDQRPFGDARRFDYLIFGVGIGVTLGFIFLIVETANPLVYGVSVAFVVFCSAVGHLLDRARLRMWRTGRWGFGVWDFLVICCLPFIGMLIVRLTTIIIRGS